MSVAAAEENAAGASAEPDTTAFPAFCAGVAGILPEKSQRSPFFEITRCNNLRDLYADLYTSRYHGKMLVQPH